MYRVEYAALTHPGRVPEKNEDNFYINGVFKADTQQNHFQTAGSTEQGHLIASVCDGMGGYAYGEQASLLAVQELDSVCRELKEKERLFPEHFMKYIAGANDNICELRSQQGKLTGSTCSVLEFDRNTVRAMNIGDSRIYRYREGMLEQLSVDHTVVGRMVRLEQITPDEARVHPMRHQITQHFGIYPEDMLLEPAVSELLPVKEHDRYLLCSDGLTDMVEDGEINCCLAEACSVEETAGRLVQMAVDAGGRDNITVIVIEVTKERGVFGKIRERWSQNRKKGRQDAR